MRYGIWFNPATTIAAGFALGVAVAASAAAIAHTSIGGFLYDWQTMIAGSLALVAAAVAWQVGQRQIAEQRASTLLAFLIEEKRRCDKNLTHIFELNNWLDIPLFWVNSHNTTKSVKRLNVLRGLTRRYFYVSGSYDSDVFGDLIKNIPQCEASWRIPLEHSLGKLFNAGRSFDVDEHGEPQEIFDYESDDIETALIELGKLHQDISRELKRMYDVSRTYQAGQAILVAEADATFKAVR